MKARTSCFVISCTLNPSVPSSHLASPNEKSRSGRSRSRKSGFTRAGFQRFARMIALRRGVMQPDKQIEPLTKQSVFANAVEECASRTRGGCVNDALP